MILGLSILPEYRRQGLARELVRQYALKEKKNNREKLILTCLDAKVPMYLDLGLRIMEYQILYGAAKCGMK